MASRTRIQESHLKALEEDSFEQLPEWVFTKGFVRVYARSLNLDEEECLRLFAERSASFYQKEKEGEGLRKIFLLKEEEHKVRTTRSITVLVVGSLFLLGVVVLLQQQYSSPSLFSRVLEPAGEPPNRDEGLSKSEKTGNASETAEDRPPSSTERQVDASTVTNAETSPKPEVAETPAESSVDEGAPMPSSSPSDSALPESPVLSPTTALEEGPLVLEIRTSEMTWVVVRSDEDEPQEVLLQLGEIMQWRAHERFLLTLGNAGGVEVRLNGQLRGPFGERGIVVRDLELRP